MRPAQVALSPDVASGPGWTPTFGQNDQLARSSYVVGNNLDPCPEANAALHQTAGPILIVEDDIAVRTMLAMPLEDANYPVTVARNGLEAL